MNMKTILLILSLSTVTGCASNMAKPNTSADGDEAILIHLPETKPDSITRSPFFNTQKTVLPQSNGFEYEFYYGAGGRYVIVAKPPAGVYLDFAQAEATLTVAAGETNPEIISLSVDRKGIFQGTGDPRNGLTKFNLQVFVPASRYNGPVDSSVDFKIKLNQEF
jgi:hypothetical protein